MSSTRCGDGQAFMATASRDTPRKTALQWDQATLCETHPETRAGHMGEKTCRVQGHLRPAKAHR